MLHLQTVDPLTHKLLVEIQSDLSFQDIVLVGGTSLALQIGHRISIDLDFFKHSDKGIESYTLMVSKFGEVHILNRTKNILNLLINNIKVEGTSINHILGRSENY